MTKTIEAAILERELFDAELKALVKTLQDDNYSNACDIEPLTELERKRILIRMGAIDRSIKWLDNLIINDLTTKPDLFTLPT